MTTTPTIEEVRALLHRDGLAEAEKITGKSYKEDPVTMHIGFIGHLGLVESREAALIAINDTYNAQSLEEHLAVFFDLGFEIVYQEPFYESSYGYNETMYILWNASKGVLGYVESYSENRVNHSKIYYNVQLPDRDVINWLYTSSHSGINDDLVLCGDHDTREGLRVAIDGLEKMGTFMTMWTRRPWYRFVNYMEWKIPNVDAAQLTENRMNKLPQEVQVAINV